MWTGYRSYEILTTVCRHSRNSSTLVLWNCYREFHWPRRHIRWSFHHLESLRHKPQEAEYAWWPYYVASNNKNVQCAISCSI